MILPTELDRVAEMAEEVRRLTDRADLTDLADRYLRALDDGVFDEERARFGVHRRRRTQLPRRVTTAGSTALPSSPVASWATGTGRTTNVSHYSVELKGDRATISWNIIAVHVHPGAPPPPMLSRHFYLGGRFDGAARRTRRGWRLRRLALRVVWTAGPGIPSIAATMAGANRDRFEEIKTGKAGRWRFRAWHGSGRSSTPSTTRA